MRVPRELLPGDLRARWLEYVLAGCLIGAVGLVLGFAVASIQDPSAEVGASWSWPLALITLAGAAILSAVAALPVSLIAARGDPIRALRG